MIYIEDGEEYEKYCQNKKKEESSLKRCNSLIKETYDLDKHNRITNDVFLENIWLEEKNKNDTIENITDIVIMFENNNYYNFKEEIITHLLENYRFISKTEPSFFGSLFGSSKKKNNYTFYIYTKDYIYYTNFEKKNNKFFTIIPRIFN